MTQEFFVDAAAAGTGSGDTPTDAFTGLGIFTDAASLPSSYSFGSRVWVRKTHVECLHLTALGGYNARLFIGPDGQNVNMSSHSAKCHFVGWPSSGDPWYENRPAAGISAGWDSDVSSSMTAGSYGWNYPLIVSSHNDANDAFIPEHRIGVYNMAFAMANRPVATTRLPIYFTDDINGSAVFDNIFMEAANYFDMGTVLSNIRKMTVVCSYGGANGPIMQWSCAFRHLVVHSMSVNPDAIIGDYCWIEHLETYANSIPYVGGRDVGGGLKIPGLRAGFIGRVTGIEPTSSDIEQFVWHNNQSAENVSLYINDYFGKGPAYHHGEGSRTTFMTSSANAMYDGLRAMGMEVKSFNVSWSRQRTEYYDDEPVIVRHISVTSGQKYHVTFPFYQAHSAHDWAVPPLEVHAPFNGGGNFPLAGSGYINAGSVSNWSGALVSGGSAWQGEFDFVAEETTTGTLRFFAGAPIAVSTNAWTNETRLFGAPTVNSV